MDIKEWSKRIHRGADVATCFHFAKLEIKELRAACAQAWAEHGDMVKRCALLRARPDLPVDRIPAFAELERLQDEVRALKARPTYDEGYAEGLQSIKDSVTSIIDRALERAAVLFGEPGREWFGGQVQDMIRALKSITTNRQCDHPEDCTHCKHCGWRLDPAIMEQRMRKAERTLEAAGYIDHGGELWQPPLGCVPGEYVFYGRTVWPARRITMAFSHPTCGDGDFSKMVDVSMRELDINGGSDVVQFIASNGVCINIRGAKSGPECSTCNDTGTVSLAEKDGSFDSQDCPDCNTLLEVRKLVGGYQWTEEEQNTMARQRLDLVTKVNVPSPERLPMPGVNIDWVHQRKGRDNG